MEKTFRRVRSAKDIIITLTLIISGTIFVALPDSDSLNILGFFILFAGLLIGLIMKTGYKDDDTGTRYSKTERFFENSQREALTKAISGSKCKIDLSAEDKGNALRLDIYHSRQAGKAYIQLFEYIPYKYEPCTCLHEHEMKNITELIEK